MIAGAGKGLLAAGVFAIAGGHISIGDYAFLLVATAYIISLFREWRPARALREELREARAQCDEAERKCADLEKKYDDLEKRYTVLERSRDFTQAFEPMERTLAQAGKDASAEHKEIVAALDNLSQSVKDGIAEVVKNLSSNTAATGILAAGINAGTVPPSQPKEN